MPSEDLSSLSFPSFVLPSNGVLSLHLADVLSPGFVFLTEKDKSHSVCASVFPIAGNTTIGSHVAQAGLNLTM